MAVFEKKVIIGFIASVVGVVHYSCVCPNNLAKKSIQEKQIFLHSVESRKELYEFLQKNVDKPVKLDIAYCYDPKKSTIARGEREPLVLSKILDYFHSSYDVRYREKLIKAGDTYLEHLGDSKEFDLVAGALVGSIIEGQEAIFEGLALEKGAFAYREDKGLYKEIAIPYSSEKGKKYIWGVGSGKWNSALYEKEKEELYKQTKVCSTSNPESVIPIGYLSGTFFVHDNEADGELMFAHSVEQPYSEYLAYYQIELEPLDKKDLVLRNY
ncbi:hypothetical protein [Helicobacter sp. MIT 14-3879]|uniref:hypothetical protein n=1 Tax=Helicobacter sp. MIT 14-3879 TaxID=2040649 RepID=UPI000E1E33F2|nr:hypothetical protein [Helicobacter sp. MIT 14-3879]RDU61333.1 hypothetical protein CQA44_09345 [Helicobacter sp. MIT 14-3879]